MLDYRSVNLMEHFLPYLLMKGDTTVIFSSWKNWVNNGFSDYLTKGNKNCWLCSSHRFYLCMHIFYLHQGVYIFFGRCTTRYTPEVEPWFTWSHQPLEVWRFRLETIILWFHVKLWEGNPMGLGGFSLTFPIDQDSWGEVFVHFQARFFRLKPKHPRHLRLLPRHWCILRHSHRHDGIFPSVDSERLKRLVGNLVGFGGPPPKKTSRC